jgi:hypothetical protein
MIQSKPSVRRLLVALALALALVACGGAGCSSDEIQDEITAVPFPSTVELASEDLVTLEEDPGDGTLVFAEAPPGLDAVKVGSVLVAGVSPSTPAGLLRAVLAVERDGARLTLRTAQAPIQLAYKKLHVRFARSAAAVGVSAAGVQARKGAALPKDFETTAPFNYMLFDGDGDPSTRNDQIAVEGTIGGGFDYEFGLDVDWGDIDALPDVVTSCLESFANLLSGGLPSCSIDDILPEAKVSFVVHPEVHVDANLEGAAILAYEKEVDLASTTLTPIILGPLVFVPTVDLTARLEGGASAQFSTGIHGSAVFRTAVRVSSKNSGNPEFEPPELQSTDFGPNETSITLRAEAKAGIGARLNLLLFAVTGPYATARAYGAIEADVLADPCWSLHAGVEGDLGVKVTSPALPFIGHVTLVDWRAPTLNPLDVEITSGQCDAPPDSSSLPPGSGPDAGRLANPTYTPWSRAFTSPVEGSIAGSPGNSTVFSDLQRTIDGHYLRAGFGVLALAKFSDGGDLIWARRLEYRGGLLLPLRVLPTSDGALAIVSTAITADFVVTTMAQDGRVIDARAFDLPENPCTASVTSVASDGAGGFYVAGTCVGGPKAFLLHATNDGAIFRLFDPGAIPGISVRVAANIEGDAFLSGAITDGGDGLFALRVTPEGEIVYAKRYDGCDAAPDAIPSAVIVGAGGEVTMAGSGGAQHNGILVRLRPDGSVGFASFPGFGFGAGSVFLLDSLAELPTTGYVAGGSAVQFTGQAPENVPSAALIGLDARGQVLWATRYTFGAQGSYEYSGHVGVRLTDDGGVMATALVSDAADPLGGHLWAFKPFARDGSISFSPGAVTAAPLEIADLDCSLTASDRAISTTTSPVVVTPAEVTAPSVALTVMKQTAD